MQKQKRKPNGFFFNSHPSQKIILNQISGYFRKIFFGTISLNNNKIIPIINPNIMPEYITVECLK